MKISYSAPAKVILSGEHAVVYGKPALVSAINLSLKFSLWKARIKINDKNILFISRKVKEYLKKEKISFLDKPFDFTIESEIPIGRGLGSSAALSVAASAAFLDFYCGRQFEKETVNNLAYQIEKHFHQNPSGADNSTACFGGLILYRKGHLFSIKTGRFDFKIPKKIEEKLFLIDSGKPKETTAEMVNLVRELYKRNSKTVERILNKIEKTTKNMESAIIKENKNDFIKSLDINEMMLEKLEVVSKRAKKLLADLSNFGYGKITGAGGKKTGSGFILFLADDKEKLAKFFKIKKIDHYQFVQDHQGLKKL